MSAGTFTIKEAIPTMETEKAILVEATDFDTEVWVPKSAIHDDSEIWKRDQETGDLVVHGWFADKRGWR